MQATTLGWIVGSLGLLAAAGTASADQDVGTAGTGMASQSAGKPDCKDAGVTVAFKVSSDELDQNARGALDGVATWLKADDRRTLYLEGFADTTGEADPNLVLSAKRADAVKSYLIEHGVDASRVTTVGRGEEIDHLPANGRAVTFLACQSPGPGPAIAQLEVPPVTPVEPVSSAAPAAMPPPPPPAPRWASGFGWAIMAGGAYDDFTDSNLRSVTNGGGAWAARFIGGTNSVVGFEAAYVGAAREMRMLGVTANNPALVSNGLEGTFRLNAPIRRGASLFEPYGYAGVGFSHFSISNYNANAQALSSFQSSDDVMNFPIGGGFAYAYKAFLADVRAGWTGTINNDLLKVAENTNTTATLNHWSVGGQVGFMF
jgi:peptidoglycan-associated lipoprotein